MEIAIILGYGQLIYSMAIPSNAQCFLNVSIGNALVIPSASICDLGIHKTINSPSSISFLM